MWSGMSRMTDDKYSLERLRIGVSRFSLLFSRFLILSHVSRLKSHI
jgi:hypothetical protein